ncbi:glycerol-3-phosphate dehydrogenase [Agarilytica rhodophyticola]|uniref:glycerol-3-phosphate dehydrogenase n=1 Tax=Agarilytica rhodophyticola TaxID=1737490 RepID=UPI001C1FCB4B
MQPQNNLPIVMPMNMYDLIVVGGGVNGCGIAHDASGRGLNVLLCEQNDLASHTSSNSSKLIHGGLRYLEHYEFRLVREALKEREVLIGNAPHIIWPLRFRLPHRPHLRPRWMILAGLFLYDNLSKLTTLKKSKGVAFGPDSPLVDEVKKGFEYSDAWVDDARLVVLNAMAARDNGADILTRTSCISAKREQDCWLVQLRDNITQQVTETRCKMLVNAAGPWVADLFDGVVDVKAPQNVRLIKGSHIVVPKLHDQEQAYILQNEDNRIVFVIPYEDNFSLIGTTDVEIKGDPSQVQISEEEISYLIDVTNQNFKHKICRDDIVHTYSGVRPLLDDESSDAQAITRDYTLEVDHADKTPPLLSVFGGKITTYRKLAEAAGNKINQFFPQMTASKTKTNVLPGGDFKDQEILFAQLHKTYPWLDSSLLTRYVRSYGTLSKTILHGCISVEDMGQHFGCGLYQREVEYLIDREWAHTVDDVIWRRSKLGLRLSALEKEQLGTFLNASGSECKKAS